MMAPACHAPVTMRATWRLLVLIASMAAGRPSLVQSENIDRRSSNVGGTPGAIKQDGADEESLIVSGGNVFQRKGCPQLITEEEAQERADNDAIPGNVITLANSGAGRAGNHMLVLSAYFAMGYCCKSKVLQVPRRDNTFPSSLSGDRRFESENRFFDFSVVDTLPLEEYDGLSQNPDICEPNITAGGMRALFLTGVHPDLMSCMNRVYLRGCEAKYLEPLLGGAGFCEKDPETHRRFLGDSDEHGEVGVRSGQGKLDDHAKLFNGPVGRGSGRDSGGGADQGKHPGVTTRRLDEPHFRLNNDGEGNAGSLVIHIRSGDIFAPGNAARMKGSLQAYGQPPLQFYLWVIGSQPWSDVSIVTYTRSSAQMNPTVTALEMMQRTGVLGPNVSIHKDRDLMTDVHAMLCADGLAISRSTLHFLTFGHSRAKHFFVPSECGHGTYKRSTRELGDGTPKPSPNNTTLQCMERPGAEVYGVAWEEDEKAYGLYNDWKNNDRQLLEMMIFNGIKGLERCCDQ